MDNFASVLLVQSGHRRCALPLEHVVETMRPLPLEPVTKVPSFITGLSIVRGSPVPVINLQVLLGDDSHSEVLRLVFLRVGTRHAALAVNRVLDVQKLEMSALQQMPPLLRDMAEGVVEAIGAMDNHLLMVLRTTRIVSEELWRALETNQR